MARTQITLTEENGRVDKEVPAAGATLRITHYKYAPAIATVGAGQGEITVLLDAGGAVTGHVTDSAGRPVIDALVVVSAGSFFRAGAVDAQGRYFIPHLAAGAYSVTLQPHQAFRASLAGEHPELIQHATRAHVAGEQTRSADVPAIGEALVDFAIAGAGR
jgi:hypothetical protein